MKEIKFVMKNNQPKYLKGVIFGDSGTGKTTFALDFLKNSCKARKLNKAILIDTEKGWDWVKYNNSLDNIEILEPETEFDRNGNEKALITTDNYRDIFKNIENLVKKGDISCIIIDSISFIGDIIGMETFERIVSKNPNITDLRASDWNDIKQKQHNIMNALKGLQCDVLLCGRDTSDVKIEGKEIKKATEKKVKGWRDITFEFDFSILAEVDMNINEKNIKVFNFLVLKSRIANDGERVKNINSWFEKVKILSLEEIEEEKLRIEKKQKEIIDKEEKLRIENFEKAKSIFMNITDLKKLEENKLKLEKSILYKEEEKKELLNILTNKINELIKE